jgi:outer membrane protein OmpA-like peptidoglycan-associated protein
LYFSSERSGGAGGRDIWVTKRNASGWDPPQNIRDVNTPYNEEAPFIHADDATLYFMSNGWPGYGGTDLFMSKNKKDQWSQPVNLGAPVNSKSGEGALYINVAGKTGYFARTVEDQIDIFSFEIPEKIKPDPATYVKWMVRHRVTDAPLQAIVTITDLKAKKVIRKVKTSTKGEMLVCLPMGIDYAFTVEKERFAFYSQNHNLTELATLIEPAEFTAFLEPITETGREKASDPVVLNNVFFVFGEADILDKSQPELDKLVLLLKENPQINIRIQGHTDNIGSDQSNLQLSQDRARSIYQFLIEKGINPARLEYEGYGATHPIADNDTEAGRQQNRRSEFVILKHDR